MNITANELKVKGISAINNALKNNPEVVITSRGKPQCVVVGMDKYNEFRNIELEVALIDIKNDLKNGNYKTLTAKEHIDNLDV